MCSLLFREKMSLLASLPSIRFELCEWKVAPVQFELFQFTQLQKY